MDQLIVDCLTMDAARIDIARIHDEFTQAESRSDRLADAVGHAALAERVQAFIDNWDHRRAELGEQLATVRDHLETAVTGFAQTDQELARAVSGQRAEYPPRTAPEAVA
ncbi:hypothetical protein [Microbacterium ulmi]|uniref:Excreted virulence factor EspC (Type VII ESX diderm) n=1 Tax=Microbacterium ulmi TaxID=179095 RepID=A0A7Y2M0P8_9MICO|nr:hypothetical protein [Microbacterium ulmi]NII70102.1 hypothetical protein [Microbacterium ulmi]NNH04356.1 hypothetical protein [Microbacterium ulmi]